MVGILLEHVMGEFHSETLQWTLGSPFSSFTSYILNP